jgi:ribosomal protein L37AE/L43A
MAQPSNEQRFLVFLEPPSPCPVCKSPRFTRVGLVDDVGIFWCADCDGVFTIPHTARASHTDHSAHEEP